MKRATSGQRRSGSTAERRRVFVALWPTPLVRSRLSEVAANLTLHTVRARRIVPANLHLTLAFIGSLEVARIAELADLLERYAAREFDWVLDRIGHFEGAQVLWAGGPDNAALRALALGVRAQLDSLGIAYDPKPFAPHVTLARGIRCWTSEASRIDPPLLWRCHRPSLVRSEQTAEGVSYVPERPSQDA